MRQGLKRFWKRRVLLFFLSRVVHRLELRRARAVSAQESAERLSVLRFDWPILALVLFHLRSDAKSPSIQFWRSSEFVRARRQLRSRIFHPRRVRANHRTPQRM